MPYYALMYEVGDDFMERRTPLRPAHLQMARDAAARGELIMAGALADPPGALLVFRAADQTTVKAFAAADPYVTEGLVQRWTVRPWTVVIGHESGEGPGGLPA